MAYDTYVEANDAPPAGPMSGFVAALSRPDAWPWPVHEVAVVETHSSIVFLAGAYAFKFKKPVNLGFLDYTARNRRLHYCREELRLNRRLAPELYLDVWGARPTGDNWVVAPLPGDDPDAEPAVRMRRFPDEAQLDRRLAAGRLGGDALAAFAVTLAAFHRAAPRARAGDGLGEPADVCAQALDNFRELGRAPLPERARYPLARLEAWTRQCAESLHDAFAMRLADGFVREGHGDLHLANLVDLDGKVVAFDGIEFSRALRWIDVVSDAGFLLMDLESRGRPDLGWRYYNAWLAGGGDYDGLAVLPWYLAYRHLVRAKVDAIRLAQPGTDTAERARLGERLCRHVELATTRAAGRQPLAIITTGYSGSGKSYVAARLAPALGAVWVRSDVERKRLHGLDPSAPAPAAPGTGLYTSRASERTYARLADIARSALAAGLDVIADAAFLDSQLRMRWIDLALGAGACPVVLACDAPPDVLRERVAARHGDPSDAGLDVLEGQLRMAQAIEPGEVHWRVQVDTRGEIDADQLAASLRALRQDA